ESGMLTWQPVGPKRRDTSLHDTLCCKSIGYPMPWLELSSKTPLDGTSPTPHIAFSSVEPPPPHQMVPENAM
ncbi:hypothetical protein Tco_0694144, partial [Tanacetum coccineum]